VTARLVGLRSGVIDLEDDGRAERLEAERTRVEPGAEDAELLRLRARDDLVDGARGSRNRPSEGRAWRTPVQLSPRFATRAPCVKR